MHDDAVINGDDQGLPMAKTWIPSSHLYISQPSTLVGVSDDIATEIS